MSHDAKVAQKKDIWVVEVHPAGGLSGNGSGSQYEKQGRVVESIEPCNIRPVRKIGSRRRKNFRHIPLMTQRSGRRRHESVKTSLLICALVLGHNPIPRW